VPVLTKDLHYLCDGDGDAHVNFFRSPSDLNLACKWPEPFARFIAY
jgi:hypothetical protein